MPVAIDHSCYYTIRDHVRTFTPKSTLAELLTRHTKKELTSRARAHIRLSVKHRCRRVGAEGAGAPSIFFVGVQSTPNIWWNVLDQFILSFNYVLPWSYINCYESKYMQCN